MTMRATTVVDALGDAASRAPDRLAFRLLLDGDQQVEDITFADLYSRSFGLAKVLRHYASPGDRALLFAETSIATIVALYACLLAGVIAVPVVPPHRNRMRTRANTLLNIVRNCSPKLALARQSVYETRAELPATAWELLAPKWLLIDGPAQAARSCSEDLRMPAPQDIAFLQYTSGTTSQPRGVIVTHAALIANQRMLYEAARAAHQEEWAVSWLPFFHDMGISFLFHAVLLQSTCTLLSPGHFIQAPRRWLSAIITPLGRAQYVEIQTFLEGYLLHSQGDRMLMGHSIEGRFPFLDYRVAEFAASLPDSLRLRGLEEKYALRRAVSTFLPKEVYERRKRPYRAPIGRVFVGEGAPEYVRELLAPARLRRAGIFRAEAVQRVVAKFEATGGARVSETDEMALVGAITGRRRPGRPGRRTRPSRSPSSPAASPGR